MLLNRRTGVPMEVDTVIRPNTAGYEVVVSVEAIARARKAGPGWVNEMVGKHEDLPTSKLILLSESGFTDTGRELALAKDAVPIAPEDLLDENADEKLVRAVPSLWPKIVTFTPESLSVKFAEPAPSDGWGDQPPLVGIDDGRLLGNLEEVFRELYRARLLELMDQLGLAKLKSDLVQRWTLRVEPAEGDALTLPVEGVPRTLYLVNADEHGYALRHIIVVGKGEVKVSEVPMTGKRLGEVKVRYAYGEGKVAGREALLVVTESEKGEGKLTIRIRPGQSSPAAGE